MPRRPPVGLALVVLLSACTSSSDTSDAARVPAVNGLPVSALVSCRTLKAALPRELRSDLEQRPTTPASDTTTAWGDPAVTLRCGVPDGSARDEPFTVNDVQWAVHDTGASRTWTTRGRKVAVAVEIPDAYDNQGELIGTLSRALVRAS